MSDVLLLIFILALVSVTAYLAITNDVDHDGKDDEL